MVVKLQNSITFENRIRKLMNEPEKVTYGYINTKTQKLDLITFQNFQIFTNGEIKTTSLFIPSEPRQEEIVLNK